jgi:hypothetical protein
MKMVSLVDLLQNGVSEAPQPLQLQALSFEHFNIQELESYDAYTEYQN